MDIFEIAKSMPDEYGPRIALPETGWPCSVLTARVLDRMFPGEVPYGRERWQQLNIWDGLQPWSPIDAGFELALHGGQEPVPLVRPVSPDQLPTLPPGTYLFQGWSTLPDPETGKGGAGHAFLGEVYADQTVRILESSVARGMRVAGEAWTGGPLPAPQLLSGRLERYRAGVAAVPVWKPPNVIPTEPSPSGPATTQSNGPTAQADEEVTMTEDKKIDITPAERDEILDRATSEWSELLEGIRTDTVSPGDFVEAAFDIVVKLATALIPGSLDDMAVGFFSGQLESLKEAAGAAADRFFGVRQDALKLQERAAQRRGFAAEHIAKAEAKEAAGSTGGFFSKSPEVHRQRAAQLIELALEDEARAASLLGA